MKSIPKRFQGLFWSASAKDLDLEKNKNYIINQALSYGTLESLEWLFKTYESETIKKVFVGSPQKIYTPASFNFVKNIILALKNDKLPQDKYVKNLPRRLRS